MRPELYLEKLCICYNTRITFISKHVFVSFYNHFIKISVIENNFVYPQQFKS